MYMDALKYLHHGLPEDLSENELHLLHEHLPQQAQHLSGCSVTRAECPNTQTANNTDPSEQNFVRRSTSRLFSSVLTICILLLPIIASLINRALQYERAYHLSERAARSASTAGVAISNQMVKLSQSPAGTACLLKVASLAQSVIEGLSDGLHDGQKKLASGPLHDLQRQ